MQTEGKMVQEHIRFCQADLLINFGLDLYDEMLHKYREENHMTLLSSID